MRISLVTATFNSVKTLERTIASVRSQSINNLEYIVVDGGSNDGTRELLANSADVVCNWVSEVDNGIYHAMNKGLGMVTGDIIGFLHADDYFATNYVLGTIKEAFIKSKADFVYADLNYVDACNEEKVIRNWKSGAFSIEKLHRGWMPPHPTVYFSRDVLNKYGLFDTDFTIAADYEWMLRCLINPGLKVFYIPEVTVKMRVGGASNKNLHNIAKKSLQDYRAIKRHGIGGIGTLVLKNISKLGQFF